MKSSIIWAITVGIWIAILFTIIHTIHKNEEEKFALFEETIKVSFELGAMMGYEAGVNGETYGCEDTKCIGEVIYSQYEIKELEEGRE